MNTKHPNADGTITKIEYFTMKELRNKRWL